MVINYRNIAEAQKFYKIQGYQSIEVPWTVSKEASSITAPEGVNRYEVCKSGRIKEFIASGEQGFLHLALKGQLPAGMYYTVTPCMRDESYDYTHVKQFMKLELIDIRYEPYESDHNRHMYMLEDAAQLFSSLGVTTETTQVINNGEESFDLTHGDVELGSYGRRQYKGIYWSYGTGIAEPRFSRVQKWLTT